MARRTFDRWQNQFSVQRTCDLLGDLIEEIEQIFRDVSNEMRACSASPHLLLPDLTGNWCVPGLIANSACAPGLSAI